MAQVKFVNTVAEYGQFSLFAQIKSLVLSLTTAFQEKKEVTPASGPVPEGLTRDLEFPEFEVYKNAEGKRVDRDGNRISMTLEDVDGPETLFGPPGKDNAIPSDYELLTGLERLEFLGKMVGIDIFGEEKYEITRKGTVEDPVMIPSYDDFRYIGCTGLPQGSHEVQWLKPTVDRHARCWECGSVYGVINRARAAGEAPQDHHH